MTDLAIIVVGITFLIALCRREIIRALKGQ